MKHFYCRIGSLLYSPREKGQRDYMTLKEFRKSKKWTQEKLAEKLGTSIGNIRNWEQGRKNPDHWNQWIIENLIAPKRPTLTDRIDMYHQILDELENHEMFNGHECVYDAIEQIYYDLCKQRREEKGRTK